MFIELEPKQQPIIEISFDFKTYFESLKDKINKEKKNIIFYKRKINECKKSVWLEDSYCFYLDSLLKSQENLIKLQDELINLLESQIIIDD